MAPFCPCTYEGVYKRSLHRTLTIEEIFYQVLHFCVCALKGTSRFSLVRHDPIRGANNITGKALRTASAEQAMTGRGNDTSACSRQENPAAGREFGPGQIPGQDKFTWTCGDDQQSSA